jgi:16S rRNA (uracil1498-N3)-methyltransferase
VSIVVEEVREPATNAFQWTIASAVPKGGRADWMIEKLSELGAATFIPLASARSVVLPEGKAKFQRWRRLAAEAAKQSRRVGVMRIEELTRVEDLIRLPDREEGWYFSTSAGAQPVPVALAAWGARGVKPQSMMLLVGPEGGWTGEEEAGFRANGLIAVSLGSTVLRVETAAVAAGAIMAALAVPAAIE